MSDLLLQLEALTARQGKFLNKGGLCVALVVTRTGPRVGFAS